MCFNYLGKYAIKTKEGEKETTSRTLIRTGFSGLLSLALIHPFDMIGTRLTFNDKSKKKDKDKKTYKGFVHCVKKLYKKHGIFSFYKGFAVSILAMVPYTLCYHTGVEIISTFVFVEKTGAILKWICERINRLFARFITHPFDTIMRYQMVGGLRKEDGHFHKNQNAFETFLHILKHKGFFSLFDGFLIGSIHFLYLELKSAAVDRVLFYTLK
jgi:hypothetical protein